MQSINAEYDRLFADFSKVNMSDGQSYTYEENEKFKAILNEITGFNMTIQIIGSWIWCFDDLGKLVQHKRYKWDPAYNEKINTLLNGVESYNKGIVREELFKQRVVETDLWVEQFSKYLPEDFNDRYAVFTRVRNHIMHNKLIDRAAFKTIKESVCRTN